MGGSGTLDDYTALVSQLFFLYTALEAAGEHFVHEPDAARFISPALLRIDAISADLRFLLGPNWREQITPLSATDRYVARLGEIVRSHSVSEFVAHHYTRYLGDLSGGQIIRTLLQRQFGFDSAGVAFYLFEHIDKPKVFKDNYRLQLDSLSWTDSERQSMINEVVVAFRLNTAMFVGLAEAKAAAAAR